MTDRAEKLLGLEDIEVQEIIHTLVDKEPISFTWRDFTITAKWEFFEDFTEVVGEMGILIDVSGSKGITLQYCMDAELWEPDETDEVSNYRKEIIDTVKECSEVLCK